MLLTSQQRDELKKAWIRVPFVNNNCIWCSACVAISPDVFKLNDEWKSVVIKKDNYEWLWVDDSISACPVNAISWE